MKMTEILEATGSFVLAAMISYSFYLFYRMLKSRSRKHKNQGHNKNLYLRMVIFSLIGFIVFFSATWLRLKQIGAFEWGWNPYTGPPQMMTCLFIGSIGITIGALVGFITGKKKDSQEKQMPNIKT